MICNSCGANFPDKSTFCTFCGAKSIPIPTSAQQYNQYPQNNIPQQNTYQSYNQQSIPNMMPLYTSIQDTTPISPWGYIGYMLLFGIPIVGIVMMFVFAFGSNTNVNLKNFARAYLLYMLIVVILYLIIFAIVFVTGASCSSAFFGSRYYY